MDSQVPGPAPRLSDLPAEVLGLIFRPLSLIDRVRLSSTCRALRHGLASSEDAWGTLRFQDEMTCELLPSCLLWLGHRRKGLRRLDLSLAYDPEGQESQAAAKLASQLAACLESSPLVQFQLSRMELTGEGGGAALQWLGTCTALTSLTLQHGSLRCLPAALELLPALAELCLVDNELGGAAWGQLRHLTALTRLTASWCRLAALPAELAALSALAALNLSNNRKLGGACWGLLQDLTTLTWLDISNCHLGALPAELAALPALAFLNVEFNMEVGAAAEEAWAPLAQCSSLTSLCMGHVPLTWLPPALAAIEPHLVDLDFEGAAVQGHWIGGEATLGLICRLATLTRLNLGACLTGLRLPEELSSLAALRDLDLGGNQSLGEGPALRHLRHLTALTRLDINGCGLKDLPEEISQLPALKDLDIGYNIFVLDIGWQRLRGLTALTRLSLVSADLELVPPQLADLRYLAELDLTLNETLSRPWGEGGAAAAAKWAALEQLTALTRLDAAFCDLPAVPAAFAAVSGLRVLVLSGNHKLGRGGVEALRPLVRMTALQRLDITYCSLPRQLEVDAIPFPLHWLEGWTGEANGNSRTMEDT